MAVPRFTLRELHQQLLSPNAETRGHAMNRLLLWVEKDPSIAPAVLPLFKVAAENETDAWTARSAVHGIELLQGVEAARPYWEKLFGRPDAVFVSRIALSADKAEHVPMLLNLLRERREIAIRSSVVRVLGRSRQPTVVFDVIAAEMAEPKMREAVVCALGDLGDPRGIPLVEPLLTDNTPIGRQDERGAMLYVSDLARDAIMMMKQSLVPSPGTPGEG